MREKADAQADYILRLEDLSSREAELHQRELEFQTRLTDVAERERDTEERRADALQEILDAQGRGPGFGCVLKKIFTIGIGRC